VERKQILSALFGTFFVVSDVGAYMFRKDQNNENDHLSLFLAYK
jgi:hypothetical protein